MPKSLIEIVREARALDLMPMTALVRIASTHGQGDVPAIQRYCAEWIKSNGTPTFDKLDAYVDGFEIGKLSTVGILSKLPSITPLEPDDTFGVLKLTQVDTRESFLIPFTGSTIDVTLMVADRVRKKFGGDWIEETIGVA